MEETPFAPEIEAAIRQLALDRAPAELERIKPTLSDDEAFVHLPSAAAAAFHLDQLSKARELAERALVLAPSFRQDWNYGNAIHLGHTVLGLLALRNEDVTLAIEELRKSGDTPGSPQLNSFGPTMQLAKEMLKRGEKDEVLFYLQQCRKFWNRGNARLDLWEQKILSGQIPNFFQHCYA